jgi:hypothetical protein
LYLCTPPLYLGSELYMRVLHRGRPVVVCTGTTGSGPGWGGFGVGRGGPGPRQPARRGQQEGPHQHEPWRRWLPPSPPITARHASRTAVVSSPELMEHVLSFLAGGMQKARRDLGRAALVCRSWRDAAFGEELWGRVASEVMPSMMPRVSAVGARRCMVERGLCVRDKRAWVGDTWWTNLRLQVEVWDMLDGACLLSAEGRIGLSEHPHELDIKGVDRVEVVGPAFSAASKDPVQRRFASIDDYFRRGGDGRVTDGFYVRVYVRDALTGRQALLWDLNSQQELLCEVVPPEDGMRTHLPEGSRRVRQTEYQPIYSHELPAQAPDAIVMFYVRPEAGQEGVVEADKLWRMAGGDEDHYDDHDSFFIMHFGAGVTEAQLVSLVRGPLYP